VIHGLVGDSEQTGADCVTKVVEIPMHVRLGPIDLFALLETFQTALELDALIFCRKLEIVAHNVGRVGRGGSRVETVLTANVHAEGGA
jgi:malate synthase